MNRGRQNLLKVAAVLLLLTGCMVISHAQTWTIGSGSGTNDYSSYPCIYGKYYTDGRQQFLYRASELTAAGMTAGVINQLGWNITSLNGIGSIENFTIKIKNSSATSLTTAFDNTGFTTIYGPSDEIPVTGWNLYSLGSVFSWDGTSSIIVDVCWTYPVSISTNNASTTRTVVGFNASIEYHSDTDPAACDLTTGTSVSTARPNLRFVRLSGCSGTPAGGTATANTTSGTLALCSGPAVVLATTGSTTGSGLTYQWEYSATGAAGTYSNISGATNPIYNIASYASGNAGFYRLKVSCTASGGTGTSTAVSLTTNTCYCTPGASAYACSAAWTSNVSTSGGVTNFSNTTACAGSSYTDYSGSISASQYPGFGLTMTFTAFGYSQYFSVFVDYNDDGDFTDAGETVISNYAVGPVATFGTYTASTNFVVSAAAPLGTHRMRVRGDYSTTIADACSALYGGETEDYSLIVAAIPACTGIPSGGTATANTTSGTLGLCTGAAVALVITGSTIATGLSYQWEYSATGAAGTYSNISGATNPIYNIASYASGNAGYYRRKVTCTASAGTGTSTVVSLTTAVCYCTPAASTFACSYGSIANVSTSWGLADFSNTSTCATTSYTNYSGSISASQGQGGLLLMNFTAAGYAQYFSVFVDYNDDGDFTDAGETVISNYGVGPTGGLAGTYSGSAAFTVSATAPTGTHRMRVRADYNTIADACSTLYGGETEDYALTVIPGCSGMPAGGTTTSSINPVCANTTSFTLGLSGSTTGVPLDYQWQQSADGTAYADISGATSTTCTTTLSATAGPYFRCRVTCPLSGLVSYSIPLHITIGSVGIVSSVGAFICNGTSTTLTATGAASYVWNTGATGATITVSPSTAATYSVIGTISGCSSSAYYNIKVVPVVTVSPTATPATICSSGTSNLNANGDGGTLDVASYCTPGVAFGFLDVTGEDYIAFFAIDSLLGGHLLQRVSDEVFSGNYDYYSDQTAELSAGVSYTIKAGADYFGTHNHGFKAWIDYDHDGIFTASEVVWSAITTSPSSIYPAIGTITIPLSVLNGTTRLRIICRRDSIPADGDACIPISVGECEDYNVNISGCVSLPSVSYTWTPSGTLSAAASPTPTAAPTSIGANTYSVTATSTAGCSATGSVTVNVSPPATGTFAYTGTPYCTSAGTVSATPSSLTAGGTYSSTAGLSINSLTGAVDAGLSAPGIYTVTYTVTASGGCPAFTTSASITINGVPSASISYAGSPYCPTGTAVVLLSGVSGGIYAGDAGLIINGSNGDVNLSASSGGTHTVTYVVPASTGCPGTSATTSLNINSNGQWLGLTSNWNSASNWCGGVPAASSNVLIPSTSNNPHVLLGNTANVNNINLATGSVFVDGGGTLNLYGNVSLSPSGNFSASGGTVNFAGSSAQNILPGFVTGTLMSTGGGNKTLNSNVTVMNNLMLTSGNILLNGNDLILQPGATITGGTAASYVQTTGAGSEFVQQVSATPVTFPVGNANYNPVTMNNTGTTDNFRVHVRDEVLVGGTTGMQVDNTTTYAINHTFDIEEDVLGGSLANITLQWNAGEENTGLFQYNHTYIAHFYDNDGAGPNPAEWHHDDIPYSSMAPAAGGWPGAGPYTATTNNVTTFSPFAIGSNGGSAPLHVQLTDVSAVNEGARNRIEWHSAVEDGLDHYEVERSTDGQNFSHMVDVAVAGHAFGYLTYDNSPNPGLTYYRLKLVEQDGSSSCTQIVHAFMKVGDNETVMVYPNPVTDLLQVEVFGASDHASVVLTDLSGKMIAALSLNNGKAEFSTVNLVSGLYLMKFTDGGIKQTIKVNKQ